MMNDADFVHLMKDLVELGKMCLREVAQVEHVDVRNVLDKDGTGGHLILFKSMQPVGPLGEADLVDGAIEVRDDTSGAEALFFQPAVARNLAGERIMLLLWVFPRCSFPSMILRRCQSCPALRRSHTHHFHSTQSAAYEDLKDGRVFSLSELLDELDIRGFDVLDLVLHDDAVNLVAVKGRWRD